MYVKLRRSLGDDFGTNEPDWLGGLKRRLEAKVKRTKRALLTRRPDKALRRPTRPRILVASRIEVKMWVLYLKGLGKVTEAAYVMPLIKSIFWFWDFATSIRAIVGHHKLVRPNSFRSDVAACLHLLRLSSMDDLIEANRAMWNETRRRPRARVCRRPFRAYQSTGTSTPSTRLSRRF
jgi:hypothetical protein